MRLTHAHPIKDLERLDTLSPKRAAKLVAHLRGCPPCARLYEARIAAERLLEHKPVASVEKVLLANAHLEAALKASSEGAPIGRKHIWTSSVVGAIAVGLTSILLLVLRPDEFQARGERSDGVSLRIFCLRNEGAPLELSPGVTCAYGDRLGFAAGARPQGGRRFAAVMIGSTRLEPVMIEGLPGSESLVPSTILVSEELLPKVMVRAGFGETADAASRALTGGPGLLLERTIELRGGP